MGRADAADRSPGVALTKPTPGMVAGGLPLLGTFCERQPFPAPSGDDLDAHG
jgi:hypothetical protein